MAFVADPFASMVTGKIIMYDYAMLTRGIDLDILAHRLIALVERQVLGRHEPRRLFEYYLS